MDTILWQICDVDMEASLCYAVFEFGFPSIFSRIALFLVLIDKLMLGK